MTSHIWFIITIRRHSNFSASQSDVSHDSASHYDVTHDSASHYDVSHDSASHHDVTVMIQHHNTSQSTFNITSWRHIYDSKSDYEVTVMIHHHIMTSHLWFNITVWRHSYDSTRHYDVTVMIQHHSMTSQLWFNIPYEVQPVHEELKDLYCCKICFGGYLLLCGFYSVEEVTFLFVSFVCRERGLARAGGRYVLPLY